MVQDICCDKVSLMAIESIQKENIYWKKLELSDKDDSETDITYAQREKVLSWLHSINNKLHCYPEAFALTTVILDKFLTVVKARPRYLKCIALTSFYLAIKLTEEDETVPCLSDLISISAAGCSVDDVIRMERILLNKLSWDINLPTSLHFLQIFHAYLMMACPTLLDHVKHMTPSRQLGSLTTKLQQIIISQAGTSHRPSTLAISLLSLELEEFRSDWFPLTMTLLKLTKVSFTDLISCRESLAGLQKVSSHCVKRKAEMIDQDDIYDSIKKLYSEESMDASISLLQNES